MKTLTNKQLVRLTLWGALGGIILAMIVSIIMLSARAQHLEKRLRVANTYISELETVVEETTNAEIGDVCGGDGYAEWYGQE